MNTESTAAQCSLCLYLFVCFSFLLQINFYALPMAKMAENLNCVCSMRVKRRADGWIDGSGTIWMLTYTHTPHGLQKVTDNISDAFLSHRRPNMMTNIPSIVHETSHTATQPSLSISRLSHWFQFIFAWTLKHFALDNGYSLHKHRHNNRNSKHVDTLNAVCCDNELYNQYMMTTTSQYNDGTYSPTYKTINILLPFPILFRI